MAASASLFGQRGYRIVLVLLAVLLPLTWGLRTWRLQQVEAAVEARQAAVVNEALADIERRFAEMEAAVRERARFLASLAPMQEALLARGQDANTAERAPLIDLLEDWPVSQQQSVEIYDVRPQLVAWQGFSMPPDEAVNSTRFMEVSQTAIAFDEDWRAALVVWWPVRAGDRVVGAVRAMRLVYRRVSEENQYLHTYSLDDEWQRATGLPVQVDLRPDRLEELPVRSNERLLRSAGGTVLARVRVQPPEPDQVLQATRARFDHLLALWAALVLGWGVAGLWSWYRRSYAQARAHVHRMAPEPADGVSTLAEARAALLRAGRRFLVVGAAWWGLRYALIALDVPNRWQRGKTPLAPLYDPTHLASVVGGGLMRSTGDLLLTALFAILFAVACLNLAVQFRAYAARRLRAPAGPPVAPAAPGITAALTLLVAGLLLGLIYLLGLITRRAILDSTLDYFARTGLMPERLVLIVFGALLTLTAAILLLAVVIVWLVGAMHVMRGQYIPLRLKEGLVAGGTIVGLLLVVHAGIDRAGVVPWSASALLLGVGFGLAAWSLTRHGVILSLVTLRNVLLTVFVLTGLLYILLYAGIDARRRIQMLEAAATVEGGRDPWVEYAIQELIEDVLDAPSLVDHLRRPPGPQRERLLETFAADMLRGSLVMTLGTYDVSLTLFGPEGMPIARYYEGDQAGYSMRQAVEAGEFAVMRQMYEEQGAEQIFVTPKTGSLDMDRFQYAGIAPIRGPAIQDPDTQDPEVRDPEIEDPETQDPDDAGVQEIVGWVQVRAEPRSFLRAGGVPFPRVLLPSRYSGLQGTLSIAHFYNGRLDRSFGRRFGRYELDEAVAQALLTQDAVWRTEEVQGRRYFTYYQRQEDPSEDIALEPGAPAIGMRVVAVRTPAVYIFDHLYYLLRLTVAGLCIGLPIYLIGLFLRWRAGLIPASRIQFRAKVLNAFLGVGIVTVAAVGFVGLKVVTGETERAVQSWLRQHLERVEEALVLESEGDEMPYRVLERIPIDSLAARIGLDLNVYRDWELVRSSRPRLARERIIDQRLPAAAYHDLYYEGYRFTSTEEQVGAFTYTAGFRALPDEQGVPRYVIAVPTLPEQERIEEERARTVAYLFGALLLLVVVVLLTASLLANALARPIARLRGGLEAVAQGRFERDIPVHTRDEIGELVQTFNQMQQQLAESRRRLAQQERQLAWREMARQVAHEIKNPLTPMKLSIQHLRRAFHALPADDEDAGPKDERFARLFDRITATLIEQIDTLARIANDFSTFARMPKRVLETVDLNAVVQEAVALMQEEAPAALTLDLAPEPLILKADREELRRIYINLIKNAFQAIPDGQDGEVHVVTRHEANGSPGEAGWAVSSVSDTGSGIPPELRNRIFEPNFSTKTSGTGLGLAIVKKGVQELRGEIDFETEEGRGTTFRIRLPLLEEE